MHHKNVLLILRKQVKSFSSSLLYTQLKKSKNAKASENVTYEMIGNDYVHCEQMCKRNSTFRGEPLLLGCPTNEGFIHYQHQL